MYSLLLWFKDIVVSFSFKKLFQPSSVNSDFAANNTINFNKILQFL